MVLEEKLKIFEVSKFWIFPYTQNWKLGNHKKFSFTSYCDSSSNLRFKNDKKVAETKTWSLRFGLRRKVMIAEVSKFPRFLSLRFCPIPKIEN